MQARNRRTGATITGTLERLYARCRLLEDGFGRAEDGSVTHEHEGGTEFFYDTSETVLTDGERTYLDENGEHVVESDIVLHEPDTTASKPPEPPHAGTGADNGAKGSNDPEAAARGIAERYIALMVAEVDDYHKKMSVIEATTEDEDPDAAESAVSGARHTFTLNASEGVEKVEVSSGLVDLQTARDALVPIVRHVNAAVVLIEGPNAIRLWCIRDGERFRVDEVSAREYGQAAQVKPDKASAAQVDAYANAILSTWGL